MLRLARTEPDQNNSADQTDDADDRRKIYSLIFSVLDFQRTKLRVFLLGRPMQAAPGKTDNANDDENDADDSSWFHNVDATKAGGRQSIAE